MEDNLPRKITHEQVKEAFKALGLEDVFPNATSLTIDSSASPAVKVSFIMTNPYRAVEAGYSSRIRQDGRIQFKNITYN